MAFIQILRQMLDDEFPEEHVLITAAVSTQGFRDVDRHYLSKLDDGWAEFMDAFYIMVLFLLIWAYFNLLTLSRIGIRRKWHL